MKVGGGSIRRSGPGGAWPGYWGFLAPGVREPVLLLKKGAVVGKTVGGAVFRAVVERRLARMGAIAREAKWAPA